MAKKLTVNPQTGLLDVIQNVTGYVKVNTPIDTNDEIQFRDANQKIYSNAADELTLTATTKVVIGPAGEIVLGDSTERDIIPHTDLKENLGTSSKRFNEVRALDIYASGDLAVSGESYGTPMALAYSFSATVSSSRWLYSQYPTLSSASRGYVMERSGSIVGNSVSTNVSTASSGDMEVQVMINGTAASSLSLSFTAGEGTGDMAKYVTVARGSVTFSQGDIVGFYAEETGTMALFALVGVIRIVYDD